MNISTHTKITSANRRSLIGSRCFNKTDQSASPLGYADPGVTPRKPALKTKIRIKKQNQKLSRDISGHMLHDTQTTQIVQARHKQVNKQKT